MRITSHCRLQSADRVGFGHLDSRNCTGQRGCRALAHVAIAADNRDLARHHHVRGAADAVDQRFLAAVFVVELGLGHGVVHVDRGEGQQALLVQIIEAVNAGRRFLGHALDRCAGQGEPAGACGHALLDLGLDDLFFLVLRDGDDVLTRLGARTEKDVERRVAAIVEDHVRAFGEHEGFVEAVHFLFQCLTLDRENRRAASRDRRCGVILGREDVAGRPAHICAQRHERFNQNCGLDRHVQRTDDPRAFQRLAVAVFGTAGHQARHFGFSDIQLFAAISGKRNILDDVIFGHLGTLHQNSFAAGRIIL